MRSFLIGSRDGKTELWRVPMYRLIRLRIRVQARVPMRVQMGLKKSLFQ